MVSQDHKEKTRKDKDKDKKKEEKQETEEEKAERVAKGEQKQLLKDAKKVVVLAKQFAWCV